MGVVSILAVASMPVLKVLLLGALGGFLATPYLNILPQDARNHLNKLVYSVFTPAVVFSNLVQALTLANVIAWWFLPINVILTFVIGGFLGLIVVKICKPEPHLKRLTIACCSAGNVGNLPLLLVPAVCVEPKSPFKQTQVCISNGLAYVSFGLAIATLILWTVIHNLLKPSQSEENINPSFAKNNTGDSSSSQHDNEELMLMRASASENFESLELDKSIPQHPSIFGQFWIKTKMWATKIPLQSLMNPPSIAVVVAFFVGGIPAFKRTLIGPSAPLRLIEDSLVTLGSAMLPSLILLLGGNLSQGLGMVKMKRRVIAGITVARLLISPMLGICLVGGASYLNLIPVDPLFHFVLLMQYTMPTAMTIGVITQLFGIGDEITVVLFWVYLASVVTTTFWTMVYIWLLF